MQPIIPNLRGLEFFLLLRMTLTQHTDLPPHQGRQDTIAQRHPYHAQVGVCVSYW
jgi:hypothetical protein